MRPRLGAARRTGKSFVSAIQEMGCIAAVLLFTAGGAMADERTQVFEVGSEADFTAVIAGALRGGDVIVLPPLRLKAPHTLSHLPDAAGSNDEEPVHLIGRALYEKVLRERGLTKADMESRRAARHLLVEAAMPFPAETGAENPGARPDPAPLTPLSGPQLSFERGAWFVGGFDLAGSTELGNLIVIGGKAGATARMTFAGNRISNCDPDFKSCLWSGVDKDGTNRNGGILLRVKSTSAGSIIANNSFENLRGFLLVLVEDGSTDTRIVQNTFRHLKPWGGNAAEAVHLGVVPIVKAPEEEPVFSRTDSLVADNLFEDASAENELIGVKSAGNRIIGNRIVDSNSGISLRDGSDTLIEDNTIIRSYGIRVMGDRQIVRDNRIVLPVRNYGIWFENGAGRAGFECAATDIAGYTIWHPIEPLRWLYRPARDPVVTGNRVEVLPGGEKTAISRRTLDKPCGWERCDGKPESRIACDRQLPDGAMERILNSSGNHIAISR